MFGRSLSHLRVPVKVAKELKFIKHLFSYPGLSCARIGMVPAENGHEGPAEEIMTPWDSNLLLDSLWRFLFSDKVA